MTDDDMTAEDFFNLAKPEEALPTAVIALIGELIIRDNVQSVSCPYGTMASRDDFHG
jgi:hypothetical protein